MQTHNDTSCAIPVIENIQNREIQRRKMGVCTPGSGGGNGGQLTGMGVFFGGIRMFQNQIQAMGG